VLVYRTPYNKTDEAAEHTMHRSAVARGYVAVIQDVRGRHASEGEFNPYFQEGKDGYDTIEWAAAQPWSNGRVGTWGLSYPGAVQWLAAVENPPHLEAMAPAMTFSTPRNFFWFDGIFDLSWLDWIHFNIAPEERRRRDLQGPRMPGEVRDHWETSGERMRRHLPLATLPDFRDTAPWYYEWLAHPPEDAYWDPLEIRGRYAQVTAAVLNLSGWYDEAYGPEGAVTNFNGLVAVRGGPRRAHLLLGAWQHGVEETETGRTGELDFGEQAGIDYDETLLRFFDHYLKGADNGVDREPPVRYFTMGANRWQESNTWPPQSAAATHLYLASGGRLLWRPDGSGARRSRFVSDPGNPVVDPYDAYGPHDYSGLAGRPDLLVFDTTPFDRDTEITGNVVAEIYASCDCRDFDLWVKLLRVDADGHAWSLMNPGSDALRSSYRDPSRRELLEPGKVYPLQLTRMLTSQLFQAGERLRILVSTSYFPRLSRNSQTGESEVDAMTTQEAVVSVHHDTAHASRLILPMGQPSPAARR
jgi:putative CocE/NonD family hydrolase